MSTGDSTKPDWAMTKRELARAEREAAGAPVRKRRWPAIVVVGLVVIGGASYGAMQIQPKANAVEAEAAATAAEPVRVMRLAAEELTKVAPQTLSRTVKVTGSLRPLRQAALTSQVAGAVEAVNFRAGDTVQGGETLVQVDTTDLENSISQVRGTLSATRAQLELARTQLETTKTMVDRGLSPSSSLDAAKTNFDALEGNLEALTAQLKGAEASLAKATVTAPFAGNIAQRSVEPNQTIAPGAPLMTIVDLSRMEVQAVAPLSASASLAVGQRVELTIESDRSRVFEGTINRINPVAIEGTRSITVYVTLDNDDGVLRGGMFASGNVVVAERQDAIAVPSTAIREDREGKYVLKLVAGEAQRQAIEAGETWTVGDMVEIKSGLAAGDVVVTALLSQLKPGMAVETAGF